MFIQANVGHLKVKRDMWLLRYHLCMYNYVCYSFLLFLQMGNKEPFALYMLRYSKDVPLIGSVIIISLCIYQVIFSYRSSDWYMYQISM